MLRYGNVIDVCCMTGQLMMRIQRGYGYDQDTEVDVRIRRLVTGCGGYDEDTEVDDKNTEVDDGMRRL